MHTGTDQISQHFKRLTGTRFLTFGGEGTNMEKKGKLGEAMELENLWCFVMLHQCRNMVLGKYVFASIYPKININVNIFSSTPH